MPDRVHSAVDKYVSSVHAIAKSSLFSDRTLASMTLFLEDGNRVFLSFYEEGTENGRKPSWKLATTIMQGQIPTPFSRYEPTLDLLRNESAHILLIHEGDDVLEFSVSSGLEPVGEGE